MCPHFRASSGADPGLTRVGRAQTLQFDIFFQNPVESRNIDFIDPPLYSNTAI